MQVAVEHDLRELGERERQQLQTRMLPVVERLAASDDGRQVLAAILWRTLQPHADAAATAPVAPRTSVPEPTLPETGGPTPEARKRRRRRGGRGRTEGGG